MNNPYVHMASYLPARRLDNADDFMDSDKLKITSPHPLCCDPGSVLENDKICKGQ